MVPIAWVTLSLEGVVNHSGCLETWASIWVNETWKKEQIRSRTWGKQELYSTQSFCHYLVPEARVRICAVRSVGVIWAGFTTQAGGRRWLIWLVVELPCELSCKSCNELTGRLFQLIGKLALILELTLERTRSALQETGREDLRYQRLASKFEVRLMHSTLLLLCMFIAQRKGECFAVNTLVWFASSQQHKHTKIPGKDVEW